MAEMTLAVRLTADGSQLVGQLSLADAEASDLGATLNATAASAERLTQETRELAQAETQAAAAARGQAGAQRQAQTAQTAATATARNQRQAFQQIGFQLQDMTAQLSVGTSATQVFAQQGGQLAGALAMMAGEGGKATGMFGRFFGFLGGPWGAAITAAGLALVAFSDKIHPIPGELATVSDYAAVMWDDLLTATGNVIQSLIEMTGVTSDSVGDMLSSAQEWGLRAYDMFTAPPRALVAVMYAAARNAGNILRAMVADMRTAIQPLVLLAQGDLNGAVNAFGNVGLSNIRAAHSQFSADFSRAFNATGGESAARYLGTVRSRANERARNRPGETTGRRGRKVRDRQSRARRGRDRSSDAEQQARELERIEDALQRMSDQWSEQPRLVQQTAAAMRDLNELAESLRRLPVSAETQRLLGVLQQVRTVVADGINRPMREMAREFREQRAEQLLILAGREREAEVQSRVRRLQAEMGPLTAGQRSQVEAMVIAEERLNDLLDKRETILSAYSASIGEVRGALEDLLSGGSVADFGRSLMQNVRQLRGRLLTEQLFGQPLRELERQTRRTGIEEETAALGTQLTETERAFGSTANAARQLERAMTGAARAAEGQRDTPAFGEAGAGGKSPDIVVQGRRAGSADRPQLFAMSQDDYWSGIARVMTAPIVQLLGRVDASIGTDFARKVGGVIEGAVAGYLQAGPVGAILGGANAANFGGAFGEAIKTAFDGSKTGAFIAQLGKSFGLRTSTTGGALGGAIGAALPIPGGDIIGGLLGSIVGGLFKKAKTGSATITGINSAIALGGNNADARSAASGLAGTVQDTLARIAEELGGGVGSFRVSIGVRDGNIHVDPTGRGLTKKKQGALDFKQDEAAAIMAAVADAIKDGGITGLSAAVQQALRSSPDIEKAMREALKVQEVEQLLGGLGGTIERAFRTFEAQAKERVRIATEYGFDVVAIERRNAEDRTKLADSLLTERIGSLRELLADFATGSLFEGSADQRRAALLVEVDKARAEAEAGTDGAAARLADLMRQLVETSREAFGTAGTEYGSDRAASITAAERVIAMENDRIRAAQDAVLGTNSRLDTANALASEANDMLAQINAALRAAASAGGSGLAIIPDLAGIRREVAV